MGEKGERRRARLEEEKKRSWPGRQSIQEFIRGAQEKGIRPIGVAGESKGRLSLTKKTACNLKTKGGEKIGCGALGTPFFRLHPPTRRPL